MASSARPSAAVSVVTDVTDTARCTQSLDAVKRQCTLEPAAAAAHLADYAAAMGVVARSIRAALGFAADEPILPGSRPDQDGPLPISDVLRVLAAVCTATHAVTKQQLPKSADAARSSLRSEVSLVTSLLGLVHGVPDPTVIRLTAKGAIRSRGAAIAADPNACLPLLAWVTRVISDATTTPVATPTGGGDAADVATAFIVIDRLGRGVSSSTEEDVNVPADLLLAVSEWHHVSSEAAQSGHRGGRGACDDDAVNRLVASDFVSRFRRRIDAAQRDGGRRSPGASSSALPSASPARAGPAATSPVPPLRATAAPAAASAPGTATTTPRTSRGGGRGVATPRLGTFGVSGPRVGVFEDTIDPANLVRQLLDGHGWGDGDELCLEDATHVLAAAKEAMEDAAVSASQRLADEQERRRAVEAEIRRLYDEIDACEGAASASGAVDQADLQQRLASLADRLQHTSAATPRLSNAFGGYTPRVVGVAGESVSPSPQGKKGRAVMADENGCGPAEPAD